MAAPRARRGRASGLGAGSPAIVVVSIARPDRARPADRRAVDHESTSSSTPSSRSRSPHTATFLVRGVPIHGYGFVYPIADRPGVAALRRDPDVYVAAKAINSVLMSLAAIPAYFLARRLLPAGLSLVVAALAVLVPVDALHGHADDRERLLPDLPRGRRSLLVAHARTPDLASPGLLCSRSSASPIETRAQAVALLPAVATAPLLLALVRAAGSSQPAAVRAALRRSSRRRRCSRSLDTVARRRTLAAHPARRLQGGDLELLHASAACSTTSSTTSPSSTSRSASSPSRRCSRSGSRRARRPRRRARSPRRRCSVVAHARRRGRHLRVGELVDRIEERNMFYVAPFALIALLGLARGRDRPSSRRARVLAGGCVAARAARSSSPSRASSRRSAVSDTFALLPWWWIQDHGITICTGSLGCARRRDRRRRRSSSACRDGSPSSCRRSSRALLRRDARPSSRTAATASYVDSRRIALGRDSTCRTPTGSTGRSAPNASVDCSGRARRRPTPVWENEFFNRSVRHGLRPRRRPAPDPLPETPVDARPTAMLVAGGQVGRRPATCSPTGRPTFAGRRSCSDPASV